MYGSEWNPSIRPNPSRDPRLITNYDSLGIRPLKLVVGSEKGNNQPQSMSHHIPISNPIYLLPLLILRPAHLLYVIHLLKIIKHSVWSHFKLLIRINTSPNTSPSSSCLYIVICVHNLIVPVLPVQYPLLNHLPIDWAIFNSSSQLSARDPSSNPTFSVWSHTSPHFKLLIRINTSPSTSPSSSCPYIVIFVHRLIDPVLPTQYLLLNHLQSILKNFFIFLAVI